MSEKFNEYDAVVKALEDPQNYDNRTVNWNRVYWACIRDNDLMTEAMLDEHLNEHTKAMYEYGVDIGFLGVKRKATGMVYLVDQLSQK